MWDATPKKVGGVWGCVVSALPKVGDLVTVTTAKGRVFDPSEITEIHSKVVYGYPCLYKSPGDGREQDEQPLDFDVLLKSLNNQKKAPVENQEKAPVENQAPPVDREQLRQLIDAAVKQEVEKRVQPMVIEVKSPDVPAVKIEGAHYLFPRLLRLISAGFNVFMWGPPGTGKTTAALQVAEALSRKAEIDTLDPTTARSMVQGYMSPNGEPVHNVFTRCWEQGKVYVADEVDLAPGHVQTLFNSALANGHAPLAWGNVEKTEGFSFVATGNTAGRPTAAFPDRRPMSNAFADRLYFLYWPLDPAIECRAVGLTPPPVKKEKKESCSPEAWVTFVRSIREWAEDNAPTLSITPRASLLGIRALAAGESPEQVADGLIFRGCDKDLKSKALRNVKWK